MCGSIYIYLMTSKRESVKAWNVCSFRYLGTVEINHLTFQKTEKYRDLS